MNMWIYVFITILVSVRNKQTENAKHTGPVWLGCLQINKSKRKWDCILNVILPCSDIKCLQNSDMFGKKQGTIACWLCLLSLEREGHFSLESYELVLSKQLTINA